MYTYLCAFIHISLYMYIDTTCSPTINQPWTIGEIIMKQPLIIINQPVADYVIRQ